MFKKSLQIFFCWPVNHSQKSIHNGILSELDLDHQLCQFTRNVIRKQVLKYPFKKLDPFRELNMYLWSNSPRYIKRKKTWLNRYKSPTFIYPRFHTKIFITAMNIWVVVNVVGAIKINPLIVSWNALFAAWTFVTIGGKILTWEAISSSLFFC